MGGEPEEMEIRFSFWRDATAIGVTVAGVALALISFVAAFFSWMEGCELPRGCAPAWFFVAVYLSTGILPVVLVVTFLYLRFLGLRQHEAASDEATMGRS